MAASDDHGSHDHDGFKGVLKAATDGLEGSDKISHQVLGAVLEELAIAAPEGCLRSDLIGRIGPGDGTTYSPGTLSKALSVLQKHGLISDRDSYAGPNGGRPPKRYMLGSERWAMLGVHVSATNNRPTELTCTVRDLSGQPIMSDTRHLNENWSDVAMEIAVCANQLIKAWRDTGPPGDRNILGVGVEVPGHVHQGHVLQADHAGYQQSSENAGEVRGSSTHLAHDVSEQLESKLTVVLDNDVNLIALRETYRAETRSRPRDGAVVAVFDEGVGAGLLVNGQVHRGHNGAAGELGHDAFLAGVGEPRLPAQPSSSDTTERPSGEYLRFSDACSCKRFNHIDCYATPERLAGELGSPLKDFGALAGSPAYDDNGNLTAAGRAFWEGGAALGQGIVSLVHAYNPGWLLLLLHPSLAQATLEDGTLGDGTAAGLYRQAIETIIDEHAFSSTAHDARQGGQRLEVRALSTDPEAGAEKAARNAAVRVLDEFVAHALKRDKCVQQQPIEQQAAPRTKLGARQLHKERLLALEKDLRRILKHFDPEGLIGAGAPADEYSSEESELLRLVVQAEANSDTVRQVWLRMFGAESKLLADDNRLNDLVRELVVLQTRWGSRLV